MSRAIVIAALLLSACSGTEKNASTTSSGGSASSAGTSSGASGASGATGTTGGSGTTGSGTSSGSTTGVPVGPALSTFIKTYSLDLCTFTFACQQEANYYYALCSTGYSAPGFSQLAAGVNAGRVQYHPDKAQQCLDSFSGAQCYGPPPQESTACQEVLTGLLVPGSPCESTADCSGGFCTGDGGCGGVCTVWIESGQACSDTNPCNPTEYLTCLQGTCRTFQQSEQQCGLPNYPNCGPGLDCMGGVCFPIPSKLTRQCVFGHGDCDEGAYCYQPAGALRGTCTAQNPINGACGEDANHLPNAFSSTDFECQDGFQTTQCVGAGTLLDGGFASGICLTAKDQNGPCNDPSPEIDLTKPYNSGCFKSLDCLGSQCLLPHGAGVACYPIPYQCDPTKAYCDLDAGGDAGPLCVANVKHGAPCTNSDQCGAFNVCDDGGICDLPTGPVCSPAF